LVFLTFSSSIQEAVSMQTRFILSALGLVPVLILSVLVSPQELGAQPPEPATSGQAGRKIAEAPPGPLPSDGRMQAQAQAQLSLLEVQKRQLQEQAKELVHELAEQEREQIEQLKGEANRQVEQVGRRVKRQIEQVGRQVKRQLEVLEAQMKLVAAQAGIPAEVSKAITQTAPSIWQSLSPETRKVKRQPAVSLSLEEKLDKILDRLERVEKRLDRLETAR
jgi:hypothetical protein